MFDLRPKTGEMRPIKLLLCTCALLVGCGNLSTEEAEMESDKFHHKFNNENYEALISATSDNFLKANSREDLTRFFRSLRTRLGKFEEGEIVDWTIRRGINESFVMLKFDSQFEMGHATEIFRFVRAKDALVIDSYEIKSPAFGINEK